MREISPKMQHFSGAMATTSVSSVKAIYLIHYTRTYIYAVCFMAMYYQLPARICIAHRRHNGNPLKSNKTCILAGVRKTKLSERRISSLHNRNAASENAQSTAVSFFVFVTQTENKQHNLFRYFLRILRESLFYR